MIIKRIKTGAKSTLKKLLDYITEPEKNGAEKCIESEAVGDFLTDNIDAQKSELISTVYEAKNSPSPAEHFILSWRPSENPTSEQIREAVQILTNEIGCTGHQVLYGIHTDREHVHAHAVINRAKDGERVAPASFLTDKQHRAIAIICDRQGWEPTERQKYRVNERGELIRNERTLNNNGRSISHGASRAEISNGTKSAERIAQEITPRAIKQANTWREFHEILSREGMKYEKKGSGAVMQIITENGTQYVKASTASKSASLSNLSKRYGAFEPSTIQEITPRQIEPIEGANPEEVREYSNQKEQQRKKQEQQRQNLRNRHADEWTALKAQQTQEQAEIINRQDWTGRWQQLNTIRREIADAQKQERERLKAKQTQERKRPTTTMPTFAEYSKTQQRQQKPVNLLPRPHRENDTTSKILKIAGAELIKATAQAVNQFAYLLKPARRQIEQDDEDEQERNERDQLYEYLYR